MSLCLRPGSFTVQRAADTGAGLVLNCHDLQGHWGEDVPPQILSQPRCKTGHRNVLALQHHCHYIWKTFLPLQMLVGSSCMTSLKEVGMKKRQAARSAFQLSITETNSSQSITHITPHLFWLAAVGIPTLSAPAAINPASSTKFKVMPFSQWDLSLGVLCSKLETFLRTCKPDCFITQHPLPSVCLSLGPCFTKQE